MTVALPKLSYELPEAAAATGFTQKQLRERIARGELRARRAAWSKTKEGEGGGKYIILATDLQEFLDGLPAA